ncbi:flagellar basal-body rod protein FlgG [bacterium]|nr:flagellar basal-body rod protein FlgG [bacterium]
MRALNIATTGMLAQERNIEVTSQNLANMTTTAYKRMTPEFQDLIYQNYKRVGTNSSDAGTIVPTGIQLGLGTRLASINRISEQGTLKRTENPLDMAINGKGYFQIELPSGDIAYTRDGTFKLSPEGEIVTSDGYRLVPGFVIPEDALDISVNRSGEIQVTFANQPAPQLIGQLEIANFINEAGLQAQGSNLYTETAASGQPLLGLPGEDNFGEIFQGSLETANVNSIDEITGLITAQRAYEMNAKVISTGDEMMQAATNAKR